MPTATHSKGSLIMYVTDVQKAKRVRDVPYNTLLHACCLFLPALYANRKLLWICQQKNIMDMSMKIKYLKTSEAAST